MSVTDRVKRALDIVSSVALIGAAAALWMIYFKSPAQSRVQEPLVTAVSGLHLDPAFVTNVAGRGSIAIVEFADFQCPFCRRHAQGTFPTIRNTLMVTGDVRYVALHFPIENIHPLALGASEASECAARQGRFWEMHEHLFRDPMALEREDLVGHAKAIGLDLPEFQHCLDSDQTVDKVRHDQAEGRKLGVVGTPAFFIGIVRPDGGIDIRKRIRANAAADVFAAQVRELSSLGPPPQQSDSRRLR